MQNHVMRFVKDELGATAIEYGLIAALIAVGIIAAARGLGSQISATFNTVTSTMSSRKPPLLAIRPSLTGPSFAGAARILCATGCHAPAARAPERESVSSGICTSRTCRSANWRRTGAQSSPWPGGPASRSPIFASSAAILRKERPGVYHFSRHQRCANVHSGILRDSAAIE